MKRYIKASNSVYQQPYWNEFWEDNPERATAHTDVELPESVKQRIINDHLDDLKYKINYGELGRAKDKKLWEYFMIHIIPSIDSYLDDYPGASWATWFDDVKHAFEQWNGIPFDRSQDAELARSDDWRTRLAVAERTEDQDILALLAEDENVFVRSEAAAFVKDPEILAKLQQDSNVRVRDAASKPRGYFKRRR